MIKIIRLEESDDGTFGVMMIDGHVFCVTLEPPDLDNKSNVSNIPPGSYTLRRGMSPKYGETFEISGVRSRSHILIHAGNIVDHTKGCVLVAQYFGKLKGDRAVLNSGKTFRSFMAKMEGMQACTIDIVEV